MPDHRLFQVDQVEDEEPVAEAVGEVLLAGGLQEMVVSRLPDLPMDALVKSDEQVGLDLPQAVQLLRQLGHGLALGGRGPLRRQPGGIALEVDAELGQATEVGHGSFADEPALVGRFTRINR